MTLRVVFLGNSESTFSNRHYDALAGTRCEIVGVVDVPPARRTSTNSRPASAVQSFVARAARDGVLAFEPASPNASEFVETMRRLGPDLFVAVGYMFLLKPEILSVPRLLSANFHASLLPAYRGKHPVFWALRNGEREVGLTVHEMDPHFDTGAILYQVRVRTRPSDTVGTAYDRIMERSVPLVSRLIEDAEAGAMVRTPQPAEGGSYYSSIRQEDMRLDWSLDAGVLRRWIQTSPGDCFADVAGRCIYFLDASVKPRPVGGEPGTVLHLGRRTATVAAGSDALYVRRLREAGAQARDAAELLRELGFAVGSNLRGGRG